MKRRLLQLALLAPLLLGATGCKFNETLGAMDSVLKPDQILAQSQVQKALEITRSHGMTLAAVMVVILCFVSFYRAHQGHPWIGFVKDWVLGLVTCSLFIGATTASGPTRGIFEMGQALADAVRPSESVSWTLLVVRTSTNSARFLQQLLDPRNGNLTLTFARFVMPVPILGQYLSEHAGILVLTVVNGVASYAIKIALQTGYTFLMVFYWVLTPLMAPFAIVPQTRPVFIGWLKSFIAVSLWPFFFALIEVVVVALPMELWLPFGREMSTSALTSDPVGAFEMFFRTQFMLVILNFVLLFVYGSVPLIASRLVNGATSPFRTAVG